MIIIGEKINGAIPSVKQAIAERDAALIRQRAAAQAEAGADFIDCAPSTAPELEYDAMVWLIEQIQSVTDKPICIDSPNARLLARILEEEMKGAADLRVELEIGMKTGDSWYETK